MPRPLYRLIALCLTLLWGPATLCCALEAAGWDVLCVEGACHSESEQVPSLDGCNPVESGGYQCAAAAMKLAPVTLAACTCLLCAPDLLRPPAKPVQALDEPERSQDWIVSWRFVRRAAAPAHAPDALNA